jgi:hypothetical protein
MVEANIVWQINVKLGDFIWHPKKLEIVDGDQYVRLVPYDYSLCKALAGLSGISDDEVKSKGRPSICTTTGYQELLRIRNQQQAANVLASPSGHEPSPMKRLFGGAQLHKQQRRPAHEIAAMRGSPAAFMVELPAVGDMHPSNICMRRPVAAGDDLFIKATNTDLTNLVRFLVASGISAQDMHSKRTYSSSGEKGVWKNGRDYYKRSKADDGRISFKKCKGTAADGAESNAGADEADTDEDAANAPKADEAVSYEYEADEAEATEAGATLSLDDLPAEEP